MLAIKNMVTILTINFIYDNFEVPGKCGNYGDA
jgi:hypothetical protein